MAGSGGTLLSRSLSSSASSLFSRSLSVLSFPRPPRHHLSPNRTLCLSAASATTTTTTTATDEYPCRSLLLDRLRTRHLKDTAKPPKIKAKTSHPPSSSSSPSIIPVPASVTATRSKNEKFGESFEELGPRR